MADVVKSKVAAGKYETESETIRRVAGDSLAERPSAVRIY